MKYEVMNIQNLIVRYPDHLDHHRRHLELGNVSNSGTVEQSNSTAAAAFSDMLEPRMQTSQGEEFIIFLSPYFWPSFGQTHQPTFCPRLWMELCEDWLSFSGKEVGGIQSLEGRGQNLGSCSRHREDRMQLPGGQLYYCQ